MKRHRHQGKRPAQAILEPPRCIGRIVVRTDEDVAEASSSDIDPRAFLRERTTIPCVEVVDLRSKTGRFCAGCLLPMAEAAYERAAGEIHHPEMLLGVLRRSDLDELAFMRADPQLRVVADYVLASRGYDGAIVSTTWDGAVRGEERLLAMMARDTIVNGKSTLLLPVSVVQSASVGPIEAAALQGRVDRMELAVQRGYKVTPDALNAAAEGGHVDALSWLLDATSYKVEEHQHEWLMLAEPGIYMMSAYPWRRYDPHVVNFNAIAFAAAERDRIAVLEHLGDRGWRPNPNEWRSAIGGVSGRVMQTVITIVRKNDPVEYSLHWRSWLCERAKKSPDAEMLLDWLHEGPDPSKYPCKGTCEYAQETAWLDAAYRTPSPDRGQSSTSQ
jgi:hypothetical protein